jgi:hypothetical protein
VHQTHGELDDANVRKYGILLGIEPIELVPESLSPTRRPGWWQKNLSGGR